MPYNSYFANNKYTRWYYQIIENAKFRVKTEEYFEKHHIVPKSLGGSNYKRWPSANCKTIKGELQFLA